MPKGTADTKGRRGYFALVVTQPGVTGFDFAVTNRVGDGKCRYDLSRFE
jgi:hypothetical protein